MGIEPLLCVAVVVIGILLQVSIAVWERLLHRWRQGIWMRERLARIAGLHGLLGAGEGAWTGVIGRQRVYLWTTVRTGLLRRWLARRAGHWQQRTRAWHRIGQPHLLIAVELAEPFPSQLRLQAAIGRGGHVPLLDPIADQLIRANGDDAPAVRALVGDARVRGPLYELLGRHPQSLITETAVYLWVEQPVKQVEPLIDLAAELARGMEQVASAEPEKQRVRRRQRVR